MTGPYGSGKSSILRTFEKKYPEFSYLNISLASFEEDVADKDGDRKRIEVSILQQIFYKVRSSKVPFSRFRRIQNTPNHSFILRSVFFVLWVITGTYIFKPNFFDRLTWWNTFSKANNDLLIYTATGLFIGGSLLLLTKLFRTYNSSRFQKLNVSSGELELAQETDTSILNKHLDEILYFFQETSYTVVVLEDLDRFQDPEIYTKLRELNNLINSSSQVKRKVSFVYALKDDVFKDTNRTKFFDFLIPVIPVINSSNSGEKLLKKFKDANIQGNISDTFISDVTLFIDDMRMLKNIFNEYVLYKTKLGLNLNQEKLLGMIVYKNFYPTDFADLNVNKGLVFESFDHKSRVIEMLQVKNEEEIAGLRAMIAEIENSSLKDLNELRAVYVSALINKIGYKSNIRIGGNYYELPDLFSTKAFDAMKSLGSISYRDPNIYNSYWNDYSFKTLEKDVDSKTSYEARDVAIANKTNGELTRLRLRVNELLNHNSTIQGWNLKQIIEKEGVSAIIPDVLKEKLLVYLLRRGYIDEMYHSFISYFYEGTITRKDMDFVISIKNYAALSFDFALTKIEPILKKLDLVEFSQKEMLNYDLLNYLATHNTTHAKAYEVILDQLTDGTSLSTDFLKKYLAAGKSKGIVFKTLVRRWQKIWVFIFNQPLYDAATKDELLRAIFRYGEVSDILKLNDGKLLSSYLALKTDFLTFIPEKEMVQKLNELVAKMGVKFQH